VDPLRTAEADRRRWVLCALFMHHRFNPDRVIPSQARLGVAAPEGEVGVPEAFTQQAPSTQPMIADCENRPLDPFTG